MKELQILNIILFPLFYGFISNNDNSTTTLIEDIAKSDKRIKKWPSKRE